MKRIFFALLLVYIPLFSQEIDNTSNINDEPKYYDFGTAEGLTIIAEPFTDEFPPETAEYYIVRKLNGSPPEQRGFIENDFLAKAGFRRTGDIKYR
jgi:hypothetical protein